MLQIQKTKNYDLAKYPEGLYFRKPPSFPGNLLKRGAMTLAMIALIESCDSAGTVGPPPVMADMVTENEARQIINRVFESNNVHLQEDIRFILRLSQNDSTELNLDGFNDTLQVGYEYLSSADWGSPVHLAWRTLDSLTQEAGPYIKVMDEKTKYPNYQLFMEGVVQEFIDTLKARGVI